MEIEQAKKILNPTTTNMAVEELKYYAGFNQDKVNEQISEAMKIGYDYMEYAEYLSSFIRCVHGSLKIMDMLLAEQIKNELGEESCSVPFNTKLDAYKYFQVMLKIIIESIDKKT